MARELTGVFTREPHMFHEGSEEGSEGVPKSQCFGMTGTPAPQVASDQHGADGVREALGAVHLLGESCETQPGSVPGWQQG